jgi:hypothetical protein
MYDVALAGAVAISVNPLVACVDRSIWKPVSSVELSVQFRSADDADNVDVAKFPGAEGWALETDKSRSRPTIAIMKVFTQVFFKNMI